jgi:hypothetical protein
MPRRGSAAAAAEKPARAHDRSGLLERDCVSIDPCFQESSHEDHYGNRLPSLAGVWLSGNSSDLPLPLGADRLSDAEAGVRSENYGSLEFALVPEGL